MESVLLSKPPTMPFRHSTLFIMENDDMRNKIHYVVRQADPKTGEARDLWLARKGPNIWTNNRGNIHVFSAESLQAAHEEIQMSSYNTPTIRCIVEEW